MATGTKRKFLSRTERSHWRLSFATNSRSTENSVEAIQNFDEEQAVNIIANTFNIEKDAYIGNSQPTFNINPVEEIKKLHEEKITLYERMLKEKDDMMARLEKLIDNK